MVERWEGDMAVLLIGYNVLHKTSKGMREMRCQDTQQFERATMLRLPIQPLLALCGVMPRFFLSFFSLNYLIINYNYLEQF